MPNRRKLTLDQRFDRMTRWAVGMILIALAITFVSIALKSPNSVWLGFLLIGLWSGIAIPID